MTRIDSRPDFARPPTRFGASRRIRIGVALASAVGVAALAGCGSSDSPEASRPSSASSPAGTGTVSAVAPSSPAASSSAASTSPQPTAQAVTITIEKFDYSAPASVSPGAMITVENKDDEKHTVTADSADAFDIEVDGDGKTSFKAPTMPGSYPFHCIFHSNMTGVLVVR
ncbi:MAG TPA: cupredoxin domain-containing protein [Jatrophihabitans sp.]|uniref:cupredoxin domain-containing protein n=1 Tax=Jatrophihabitans sp. TaxID=1932789 RepID=UPI002EE041F0